MELNLIIKYRTQLMGIAIIWIMLFHSTITSFSNLFLGQIKYMGYFGVDIFIFLSGVGIYFSYSKYPSLKTFYVRRFIRIIPYYIPIVFIFSLFLYHLNIYNISDIIINVLMLGFWLDINPFDWYIPTLCTFYLISPFFIEYLNKNIRITLVISTIIISLLWYFVTIPQFSYLGLGIMRLPIYFFGIIFGYFYAKNPTKKLSATESFIIIFLSVTAFFLWRYLFTEFIGTDIWLRYGLSFFYSLITTIPFCFSLTYFLSILKNYKYPILSFFGSYSLPIYIAQVKIIDILVLYDIPYITIISTTLTLSFAVIWQKTVNKILAKYFN